MLAATHRWAAPEPLPPATGHVPEPSAIKDMWQHVDPSKKPSPAIQWATPYCLLWHRACPKDAGHFALAFGRVNPWGPGMTAFVCAGRYNSVGWMLEATTTVENKLVINTPMQFVTTIDLFAAKFEEIDGTMKKMRVHSIALEPEPACAEGIGVVTRVQGRSPQHLFTLSARKPRREAAAPALSSVRGGRGRAGPAFADALAGQMDADGCLPEDGLGGDLEGAAADLLNENDAANAAITASILNQYTRLGGS